jgi:hypothetical protein
MERNKASGSYDFPIEYLAFWYVMIYSWPLRSGDISDPSQINYVTEGTRS